MRLENVCDYAEIESLEMIAIRSGLVKQLRYEVTQAKYWFKGRKSGINGMPARVCNESYQFYSQRARAAVQALRKIETLVYGGKYSGVEGKVISKW